MWRLFYTTMRHPAHRRQAYVALTTTVAAATGAGFGASPAGILFCEASSSSGNSPKVPKPPPTVTFRRRRLSVVSPEDEGLTEDAKGESAETAGAAGQSDDKPKRRRSRKSSKHHPPRVLRAVEIEDVSTPSQPHPFSTLEGFRKSLPGMHIFGSANGDGSGSSGSAGKHHHTTYAAPKEGEEAAGTVKTKSEHKRPFPSDKVGTFSAHGIEPHPYIVREAATTFSDGLGEPKVLTLVTKKINQDRGVVTYPFGNCDRTALFAVYDGHGVKGELVAEFAMNEVQKRLQEHSDFSSDLEKAFHDSFRRVDSLIARKKDIAPYQSGTTACVVILRDKTLCISNVGDSRAVLGRRRRIRQQESKAMSVLHPSPPLECIELTKDQNACCPIERKRIIQSGGFVSQPLEPGLPARIWLDKACTMVGLAMSRSLGDFNLKHVGVIADPVVTHHDIENEDEFLIIATDGVWEFIDSDEAVRIVGDCFSKGLGASEACVHLIQTAMKTWKEYEGDYRDDITAIVIRLPGLWDEHGKKKRERE